MVEKPITVPEIILRWERVCHDIMARTETFPRNVRYSLAVRIDNAALDVLESLTRARFATGARRRGELNAANAALESLRVLLRMAFLRRCLSESQWMQLGDRIDECGRMIGGWLRHSDMRSQDRQVGDAR